MELSEPKIVELDTFKIIGTKYFGKNQHDELKKLWNSFYPRMEEIKNRIDEQKSYGICKLFPGSSKFSYISSVKVANSEEVPENMICKIIPFSKYAIFTHKGSLNSLGQTYEYIYGIWLPNSSYEHSTLPDIEEYDNAYCDPNLDEYVINIYIPIK
ncbi:GyrI-like domain-containing protein [Haloimpatiens lingqiaonensis]|uniref:GyrI-like domain-containing protein n=1 Tax=Haloimpatiens lingqiaonensis TaxID=1380675 RepID=UPI0014853692|nr:GyrI-like domain-containing protein [Haloimpatiens lingqiaonensis]